MTSVLVSNCSNDGQWIPAYASPLAAVEAKRHLLSSDLVSLGRNSVRFRPQIGICGTLRIWNGDQGIPGQVDCHAGTKKNKSTCQCMHCYFERKCERFWNIRCFNKLLAIKWLPGHSCNYPMSLGGSFRSHILVAHTHIVLITSGLEPSRRNSRWLIVSRTSTVRCNNRRNYVLFSQSKPLSQIPNANSLLE